MAGNTFKWLGNTNNNDAATLANWLVNQSGAYVAAAVLPGTLDTITFDNGGIINDSSGDLPLDALSLTFAGSGGTLELGNLALQRQNQVGSLNVVAGTTATVLTTGSVTDSWQTSVSGAGATLDLQLGGSFDLQNALFAENGGAVNITASAGGTLLANGGVVAFGGTVDVATTANGNGLLVVGGGGRMTLQSVGAGEAVAFIDNTGTLVLQQTGTVGSAMLGLQAGDAIDLTAISDATAPTITVNGNFTTISDGINSVVLPLFDAGFTSGSFTTTSDGSGHVLLQTTQTDATWLNGANGDWSAGSLWSTGVAPTSTSNVVIASLANTFAVTATNESASSVLLTAPSGTLALSGSFTAGRAIFDTVGIITVGAGAVVTAKAFSEIGGGGSLEMVGGAQMTLTGGVSITGLGTLALDAGGLVSVDGSTINAAGAVLVGNNTGGQLTVQDLGTVTATAAVVNGQGYVQIQDGGVWSIANGLLIGGGNSGTQPVLQLQQGTSLLSGGSLSVGGAITISGGTLDVFGGSSANAAGGVTLSGGALSIDSNPGSVLNIGTTGAGGASGLVVDAGAAMTLTTGVINVPTLIDNGTIFANGNALLDGAITGSGTIDIAAASTLLVTTGVTWNTTVDFTGAGSTLVLSNPSADTGVLLNAAPPSGSGLSNTIDINTLTYNVGNTISYNAATGGLALNGGGDGILHFGTGLSSGQFSMAPDGSGHTAIVVAAAPCYAVGTRLATPGGEAAVERLQPDDAVLALQDGAWVARRVRWVGRTTLDLARHPQPDRAAPVRIRAHAFAPDMPSRDLLLSPEHAVFVDGVLMQAHSLLNGASITQEFPARITYFHVELDRHAVLCAEGLPAESYLDTGNRALFAGTHGVRALHPDFATAAAWTEHACAPLVLDGPRLAAVHARLRDRAEALGFALTERPALRVLADRAELVLDDDGTVLLPAGTTAVRLVSRSFVAAWLGLGDDRRRLGIAVAAVALGGAAVPEDAFGPGWHAPEAGWRWTDGDAHLALAPLPCATTLRVTPAAIAARYWTAPLLEAATRAA